MQECFNMHAGMRMDSTHMHLAIGKLGKCIADVFCALFYNDHQFLGGQQTVQAVFS